MTTLDNSLPAVLKRRLKKLEEDGYNEDFVRALATAADELATRRRFATEGEEMYLEAVADNRRLRTALSRVFNMVRLKNPKGEALEVIKTAMRAMREPGVGRRLFTVELTPDMARATVEAQVKGVLDDWFKTSAEQALDVGVAPSEAAVHG